MMIPCGINASNEISSIESRKMLAMLFLNTAQNPYSTAAVPQTLLKSVIQVEPRSSQDMLQSMTVTLC